MKLGVLTVLFQDRPLDAALDQLVKMGVQAVEIGTGAYFSKILSRKSRFAAHKKI